MYELNVNCVPVVRHKQSVTLSGVTIHIYRVLGRLQSLFALAIERQTDKDFMFGLCEVIACAVV